jgi:hypothetical protein
MIPRRKGRGLATKTLELIVECQDILEEIQPASVRAVCYRLFVKGLIPDMSKNSTGKVSRILTIAREKGYIPWNWIVDESRSLERVPQWSDPDRFLRAVTRGFRCDYWDSHPVRVEIWSEKGTMRGTLKPVLDHYGVGFRVMHGFGSATVVNDIADATQDRSQRLIAFYIGDWDPSGLYMSSVDLPKRLVAYGARLGFERIALTDEDIRVPEIAVTTFSAHEKRKDPRYTWFLQNIGEQCWEVDAMTPVDVRDRVEHAIVSMIDPEEWQRHREVEAVETQSIGEVVSLWNELKRGA